MTREIEVFCDFDGTVTHKDVFDCLLEKIADPPWEELEEKWLRGEISSRDCMALQTELLRGGWSAVTGVLKDVVVDPTFNEFVAWCKMKGIPLVIVSDGLDRVIHHIFEREKIAIDGTWANRLEEKGDRLTLAFPHAAKIEGCNNGLCKCLILEEGVNKTPKGKPLKVVIGDGRSDFCWSKIADRVYAKGKLLQHCRDEQIQCIAFENFDTIRADLERLIASETTPAIN